jgi:hypothetical protein
VLRVDPEAKIRHSLRSSDLVPVFKQAGSLARQRIHLLADWTTSRNTKTADCRQRLAFATKAEHPSLLGACHVMEQATSAFDCLSVVVHCLVAFMKYCVFTEPSFRLRSLYI